MRTLPARRGALRLAAPAALLCALALVASHLSFDLTSQHPSTHTLLALGPPAGMDGAAASPAQPPFLARRTKYTRVISLNVFFVDFHRDEDTDKALAALAAASPKPLSRERYLNRYFLPLINNIINWKWLLPDWNVRVYISAGHPFIPQLRRLGAEVVEKPLEERRWSAATAWRFLVEDDEGIEYWGVRESESPPTYQDAAALLHWIGTGLPLHVLAMAGQHTTWNAGHWGSRRGFLTRATNSSMAAAVDAFAAYVDATRAGYRYGSKYGDDQYFMATLWGPANMRANGIVYRDHDCVPPVNHSWCAYARCGGFPAYPGKPDGFHASMNTVAPHELILCHHREAPYCRRHNFGARVAAWRGLYELCTGRDFMSDALLDAVDLPRLGFTACPYTGVAAADVWAATGAKAQWQ